MKLRPGNMKATFKLDPFPHVLLEDIYTKGEWEAVMRLCDHSTKGKFDITKILKKYADLAVKVRIGGHKK